MAESSTLPAPLPLPDIVSRYRDGESLTTLAHEHHVNRSTIYRWILGGLGDAEHEQVITDCLVNRISNADEQLETAPDSCNIARAREMARFARMDFERRRPKLYGPKQEIDIDKKITVIIQRSAPQPVVIEAQAASVADTGVSDINTLHDTSRTLPRSVNEDGA